MSVRKTWALTVLLWGAMATVTHADPISLLWDWRAWGSRAGVREMEAASAASSSAAPRSVSQANAANVTMMAATSGANPAPTPTPSPSTSNSPPDAYLNFGTSSYPEQSVLTVGNAQPWYTSGAVAKAFGHTPDAQEQQGFINAVVQDVQQTFTASGLTGSNAVSITTDPNAGAHHTMSIVSGLSYAANPNAIGITDVGANGFGFIDKLDYASSPDQLEWAVAHNVTHELMHAFGVAAHDDQTGDYLDAATAKWSVLTDPQATLSPAAVSDIIARDVGRDVSGSSGVGNQIIDGDQEILAPPVPEPSTVALWMLALGALVVRRRRLHGGRRAAVGRTA